jgi:GMP synthase PP-ATPase subunit
MKSKDRNNLKYLAREVDRILKEELKRAKINYDMAEARIYDVRSVGVQGDERSYEYPAEIELRHDGKVVWDTDFTERLSNRVTNEVKGINRILYVWAKKK